jgi:FAD/FMN-containing dehydrogenase
MVKASMITVSNAFSSVPPLFGSLARVLSGDIDCSHRALKAHSTDGSPYAVHPQAIIYPKTTADIKHAIAFCREYSIPITVCGGQAASSGGSLSEGLLLDMTRYFSHIRHVNMMEHTVTVDAGVTIDELCAKLASWNLEVPVLEEELSSATIGGLVATKSATQHTFYAGTIREWIEGLTVVIDSGEEHQIRDGITPSGRLLGIYQSVFPLLTESGPTLRAARRESSDDATGYSLWNTSIGPRQLLDQLVGSEGTLAVITSITLRVTQKKYHTTTLLFPVSDFTLLQTYADIARHHHSEGLYIFDATTRKLIDMFHPLLIQESVPGSPVYLLVTVRDNDEHILKNRIAALCKALPGCTTPPHEVLERSVGKLTSRTLLHELLRNYSKGSQMVATAAEGIIVSPHIYAEALHELDEELGKHGRMYTLTGYVGSGHIALTTLFDANSLSYESDLQEYRETIGALVQSWKGGLSATGGDGLERTAALPFVFNEATRDVFKKLKAAWDPFSIFNPSKKILITKDYLVKHAARTLD